MTDRFPRRVTMQAEAWELRCAVCRQVFRARMRRRKTCSDRCRQALSRRQRRKKA